MKTDRCATCCFSGHRPQKIRQPEHMVRSVLRNEIKRSTEEGYKAFICGMANGFDLWAAEEVVKLKSSGIPIKLICAFPYPGFNRRNTENVTAFADEVVFVSKSYTKACFRLRNEWMTDRSGKLIAYFTGAPGGTLTTVKNAIKNGVRVVNVFESASQSENAENNEE